ncbi:MAG: hypothetical protein HC765_15810 [Brachymonas sp.]|nr:hypothetical protein [Brachymonas sp.]
MGGSGGTGGVGGQVVVNQPLSSGSARVQSGAGGAGGTGGAGGNAGKGAGAPRLGDPGSSGQGGNAGNVVMHAMLSTIGNAEIASASSGAGGAGVLNPYTNTTTPAGSAGAVGRVTGSAVTISAGGNLSIAPQIIPTSGNVSLSAGTGISNGAGGAVNVNASLLTVSNSTSGDVLVVNQRDIALGTVNAGRVSAVARNGNITLNGAVAASAAGDAIVLAGNNFINNSGASALSATAPGSAGRWLVYSNSPLTNSFGGIQSGNLAVWGTAFNLSSPSRAETGNRFVFAASQSNDTAIQALDVRKTFGDTVNFSSPVLGTDYRIVSLNGGASFGNAFTDLGTDVTGWHLASAPVLSSGGAAAGARRDGGDAPSNVGGASYVLAINSSGINLLDASNNVVTGPRQDVNGTLTVTPLALTGSITADTRTYDGTTNATVASQTVGGTLSGAANVQLVNTGVAFVSRNAGSNVALTVSGASLSGTDAINYSLSSVSGSGTINKADLTISAVTDSRQYTGLAGSNAAPNATGIVAGDSISGLSQSFDSANAGSRVLSVNSGYVINDQNSGNNYNLTVNTASGSISKANLTATANDVTRTYDGTTNGNSSGVAISGFVNGETSSVVNTTSLGFDNSATRNAGSYSLNASGLAAQNYDIAYTAGNLTINKADLTISAASDSRQYNGLAGSNAAPNATTLGAGDTLTGLSQSFDSANAGARTLSVNSGFTLNDGNNGGNYNLTLQTASGSISKANATVTANSSNLTYNGQVQTVSGFSVSGLVNGETETVLTGISASGSGKTPAAM